MRLIRLKIRNIASLQGEHEINFQEIQKHSSLFAITGETGSGKSTILNSLGLALYGQLYKKNLGQLDVVTLGEKEGSIEIIFQVREKYYLADWRARVRKQNGELYSTPQSPVRLLYKIDGPDFSFAKNVTEQTAQELLNLDFDQFCKCIILNQGEFARFLQSSFSERKEILEKLYPGELLESMGRELHLSMDVLKKEKSELEIKMGELEGSNVSGDLLKEQKAELSRELKLSEDAFKQLEKVEFHFTSLSSYHAKYLEKDLSRDNLKRELVTETTKFNELLKSSEECSERFDKMKLKVDQDRPLLQSFLTKEENLRNLEEQFTTANNKKSLLEKSVAETLEKLNVSRSLETKALEELSKLKSELTFPIEDLKSGKDIINEVIDLFSESGPLRSEVKGKSESLASLELQGKELRAQVTELEKTATPDEQIKDLESQLVKRQKAKLQNEELAKQLQNSKTEENVLNEKIKVLKILIQKTQDEILPLEATLKLQEVLTASDICVSHALNTNAESCPVCEQPTKNVDWINLKNKLGSANLAVMKKKFDEGNIIINKSLQDHDFLTQKTETLKAEILEKENAITLLAPLLKTDLSEETLALKIEAIKKSSWEKIQKSKELDKTREQYGKIKKEHAELEELLNKKLSAIEQLTKKLPAILTHINADSIRTLKEELRNFQAFLNAEVSLNRILQNKLHLEETLTKNKSDFSTIETELAILSKKINELKNELSEGLKGSKASDLIKKMDQEMHLLSDERNKKLEAQKNQDSVLKNLQGRLSGLDDLIKEFDVHFSKELHELRTLGDFLVSREESQHLFKKLKTLDLNFKSPKELFIPLTSIIQSEKSFFKEKMNAARENLAAVSTRLSEWEKLQDKIKILEAKHDDVVQHLNRKLRLFEVLGKDELRTFVLSLVEENLIYQTNEELQKLCQGRYEIIHQTKSLRMTPEFFILDKFREGGKRKVSTLSGGETFMVSLAMALGLAEMTRGQAEIDSLFIDEGFGTLDQDSLDDVLDMLKQIETRGLMVGIISHIKNLTTSIPVNLVLSKKQDGVSSISVRMN